MFCGLKLKDLWGYEALKTKRIKDEKEIRRRSSRFIRERRESHWVSQSVSHWTSFLFLPLP
jgi:hypothetical protein